MRTNDGGKVVSIETINEDPEDLDKKNRKNKK